MSLEFTDAELAILEAEGVDVTVKALFEVSVGQMEARTSAYRKMTVLAHAEVEAILAARLASKLRQGAETPHNALPAVSRELRLTSSQHQKELVPTC